MTQLAEPTEKVETNRSQQMERWCIELLNEWLFELTAEEQEVWLWNATVEMARIKRRRSLALAS